MTLQESKNCFFKIQEERADIFKCSLLIYINIDNHSVN